MSSCLECEKSAIARGMCPTHYQRWKKSHRSEVKKTARHENLRRLGLDINHPFRVAWQSMKTRCDNRNAGNYARYGGRGVTYCEEWKDFMNFYNDMWPDWFEGMTLERRKNSEGYSPDNCRWASLEEQAINKGR